MPSPSGKELKLKVGDWKGRLDLFLHQRIQGLSRQRLKKLIKSGNVRVNSIVVRKPAHKVKEADVVSVLLEEQKEKILPQPIPLDVIYEDEHLIVINKPPGILVHPTSFDKGGTLVNALVYRFENLSAIAGPLKPGIVHRLDRDTSGVLVVAKDDLTHAQLAQQFKERSVKKIYLAVLEGEVEFDEGLIEEPIARGRLERKKMRIDYSKGRYAQTYYKVLKRLHGYSFVLLYPKTGRTHQLRVHMKYKGYPIVGDAKYGRRSPYIKRQALHAYKIRIRHPRLDKEMEFEAPLPGDFRQLLTRLGFSDYECLLKGIKMEV